MYYKGREFYEIVIKSQIDTFITKMLKPLQNRCENQQNGRQDFVSAIYLFVNIFRWYGKQISVII